MNISTSAYARKTPDLVIQFASESSVKTECPVCRSIGGDTAGDNLQIGHGRVTCWADKSHGDQLWRELRNRQPGDTPTIRRRPKQQEPADPAIPDGDPGSAFFDHDDAGNARQQDDAEAVRTEVELLFLTFADDLDAMPEEALSRLLTKSRGIVWRSTRMNFEATFAAGRILRYKKALLDHGLFTGWLDDQKVDRSWAARAMKVASRSWEEIQHHNSCGAVLAEMRAEEKAKRGGDTRTKAQLEKEGYEKTIAALEAQVEELKAKQKAENPTPEDIVAELAQVKRENQVLRNRNVQHARENRRLSEQVAKLEAASDAMKIQMCNNAHLPAEDQMCTEVKNPLEHISTGEEDPRMTIDAALNRRLSAGWKQIVKSKGKSGYANLDRAILEAEQAGDRIPVLARLEMLGLPRPDFDDCMDGSMDGFAIIRNMYEDHAAGSMHPDDD